MGVSGNSEPFPETDREFMRQALLLALRAEEEGEVLAETAIGDDTYTVEAGDTIWSIASKVYGDPYRYTEILNANPQLGKLPNGNVLIHRGNVLNVPQR